MPFCSTNRTYPLVQYGYILCSRLSSCAGKQFAEFCECISLGFITRSVSGAADRSSRSVSVTVAFIQLCKVVARLGKLIRPFRFVSIFRLIWPTCHQALIKSINKNWLYCYSSDFDLQINMYTPQCQILHCAAVVCYIARNFCDQDLLVLHFALSKFLPCVFSS